MRSLASILIAVLLSSTTLAQDFAPPVQEPEPEPDPQPVEPEPEPAAPPMRTAMDRVPELRERLAALDASDAMVYIELAEEVSSETGSPQDRDLARHLYAVAYDLERNTRSRPEVMAGACLGLASLEASDEGSAWLYAVAGLVDPRATRGEGAA